MSNVGISRLAALTFLACATITPGRRNSKASRGFVGA